MRRIIVVGIIVVGVAIAAPVGARAAGNSFRFTVKGPGATGFWTNLPLGSDPVPGTVYTDVFIDTAQQAVSFDGETFEDKFVFADRFNYKFDANGNFIPISEVSGSAGGDAVSLSVDVKNLSYASVSATLDVVTCTFHRNTTICGEKNPTSLSASWNATGPLQRSTSTFHFHSRSFTDNERFRGKFRDATATATGQYWGGFGASAFARIFDTSDSDVSICHGC